MAFALSLQAVHDLPGGSGNLIFSATTAIVMITVGLKLGDLKGLRGGGSGVLLGHLGVVLHFIFGVFFAHFL